MAKLDWLENNNYLKQEIRRQYTWAAWFVWGIALILLLIPVRGSACNIYYISTAEDTPSLTGHVLHLEPGVRQKIRGGKGRHYEAKVDIEYNGRAYYVTNAGFNFTDAMYRQAIASGRVPVYLHPTHPEKSVLSKGVPFLQYFALTLFSALALFLIATGFYLIKKR